MSICPVPTSGRLGLRLRPAARGIISPNARQEVPGPSSCGAPARPCSAIGHEPAHTWPALLLFLRAWAVPATLFTGRHEGASS